MLIMENKEVYYDRHRGSGQRSRHYGRLCEIRDENGKVTGYSGSIEGFAMTIWSRARTKEKLAAYLFGITDLYHAARFHDNPGAVTSIADKDFIIN